MRCKTKFCRNEAQRGHYCNTCCSRKYRKRNPIRAAFQNHKSNAKRRGIISELTFKQFEQFGTETKYFKKKGIYQKSWHMDRKIEGGPYAVWNIQVLPNDANVKKFLKYRYDEHERKMQYELTVVKLVPATADDALPF